MLKRLFIILAICLLSFEVLADNSSSCGSVSTSSVQTKADDAVIPNSVMQNINLNIKKINDTVTDIMVIGQALNCHAVYTAKHDATVAGINLFSYPDISIWLCGSIIYFMGFMITLSITFYLVDIGFKLGLALIMLPVGIALWPFAWTKDKLVIIISMILKSAAIFAFLSLTVSYAYQLVEAALEGSDILIDNISKNQLDYVADNFTLTATMFLLCIFALVYGMKLIGSTIADYVDKFFPDQVLGSASPIHGSMTQMMDFAKQKIVAPVASYAKDVVKTQVAGRITRGTGKLMSGQYNDNIRKAAHYAFHPSEAADKAVQKVGQGASWVTRKGGKAASSLLTGSVGRALLGTSASRNLQQSINAKLDNAADKINVKAQNLGSKARQGLEKTWVGTSSATARTAVHSVGDKTSQKYPNVKSSVKQSKIGRAVQKANGKVKSYMNTMNRGIQKIESVKQSVLKKIDNPINKAVNWINQKEQQWTGWSKDEKKYIDKMFETKASDKLLTRGWKSVRRGWRKLEVNAVASVVNTPIHALAAVARAGTIGAGAIAKMPARIVSGVAKAPIQILKLPVTVTKTVFQVINPKNVWTVTASVLTKTGDDMMRNKKTASQLASEKARKQAEEEEEEYLKKLKKQEEEDRL